VIVLVAVVLPVIVPLGLNHVWSHSLEHRMRPIRIYQNYSQKIFSCPVWELHSDDVCTGSLQRSQNRVKSKLPQQDCISLTNSYLYILKTYADTSYSKFHQTESSSYWPHVKYNSILEHQALITLGLTTSETY